MSEGNELGLVKIRRALISVSDKTGIVDFARELKRFDVEIISTGGTAKALRDAGIELRDVSDVTGFPEMMDGRIKTLHPKIHGALLGLRDKPEHVAAMREYHIEPIDMVVVNLYPFKETIKRQDVTQAEAIEQIDIGGPAMIRSAAKNWQDVAVVTLPKYYPTVIEEMKQHQGSLSLATRGLLAREAFGQTAMYDGIVLAYLLRTLPRKETAGIAGDVGAGVGGYTLAVNSQGLRSSLDAPKIDSDEFSIETFRGDMPGSASLTISKTANLRYGENPHQIAALYKTASQKGIANAELLSGKEMSFNNYVDADAAWQLVCDFDELACAVIKHTNPAGVALAAGAEAAYRRALAGDPTSAFGGIVAFNRVIDEAAARAVIEIFTEVLIAPDYEPAALEGLKSKKNPRLLRARLISSESGID